MPEAARCTPTFLSFSLNVMSFPDILHPPCRGHSAAIFSAPVPLSTKHALSVTVVVVVVVLLCTVLVRVAVRCLTSLILTNFAAEWLRPMRLIQFPASSLGPEIG